MNIRQIQAKDDEFIFSLIRCCLEEAKLNIPGTAYFDESIKKMSEFYLNNNSREYFVLTDEKDNVIGGAGFAEFNNSNQIAELQKLPILDPCFMSKIDALADPLFFATFCLILKFQNFAFS